jgi:DNA-binding CsgD family transcriptional regulator/tetratricopeptide (TPR) repeat protein
VGSLPATSVAPADEFSRPYDSLAHTPVDPWSIVSALYPSWQMTATPLALFRGRIIEREDLDRLLATVTHGRSQVLVVRGEAGVGKSALIRYAAGQAAGFRVAQISGIEPEMELPFAGLHQLCSPMLAHRAALPEPQQAALRVALGLAAGDPPDRFLVALAVLSLMAEVAEERPLLCLIDDAQWLDGASSQVLGFVARRLLAERVAIVFAVRDPGGMRLRDLAGLPEMRLGGLADAEARALLESVVPGPLDAGVRDRIVAETRGNPLALLELPRGLAAGQLAGGFALPDAANVPGQIEDAYGQRIAELPRATQRLMLLAAADAVGDATLLWRAAAAAGLDRDAAEPAAQARLLEIGARVRFRHPLVRSAVYRAASLPDRRAAHGALASATDPGTDPDRRAWHRAHAATAPNDDVAQELLDSATRAQSRGGIAATAAFLDRAVTFTADPGQRASRALAAARAKFEAGDYLAAESLQAGADAGPLDELGRAELQRMRAQMAFDLRRGRDAPGLLGSAARRLEPLDPERARETHLEALIAAIYAGQLADARDIAAITRAAHAAPLADGPLQARHQLLPGLATRLTGGYVAAAPMLTEALTAYLAGERRLDWRCVAFNLAAMDLWDDEAWLELASSQARLAHRTGTLILLPYALDYLASFHVQAGDLAMAAGLVARSESLHLGARAETLPYMPLRLAAWRGEEGAAADLFEVMIRGAQSRGEGCAVTAAHYAMAILHNGLGQYDQALGAAQKAVAADEIATSSWALYELTEAASRSGRMDVAREAADRLWERTSASGTPWARGTGARARALVEHGDACESRHLEALTWLGQTRMGAPLARARLTYGEWLRREGRRVDAREQLRDAYEVFVAMGANGFADRARRELLATGEKVRKRRGDTRDELTPQEEQIARLAGEGRTNPEIGAELYLSPRTVEWHLRKVFTKLGITSRKDLNDALAGAEHEATPV